MTMDSAQMVERCRRHDKKAQRALYDMIAPMVGGICARYSSCHAEAQDMMQDVFVKVFERIGTLNDSANIMSWTYSMAVNTCIDQLRRRRHWQPIDETVSEVPSLDRDPFVMADIVAAMQQLTPMLRTVFNLCDVEGYSLDEVAERIGSNNLAVRVALHRARKELRSLLEDKHNKLRTNEQK